MLAAPVTLSSAMLEVVPSSCRTVGSGAIVANRSSRGYRPERGHHAQTTVVSVKGYFGIRP